MAEIGFAEIGAIVTAVATIALVFVLWITIKQLEASEKLFTILYFEYEGSVVKSGYGMISGYNPSTGNFTHRDMWTDDVRSA